MAWPVALTAKGAGRPEAGTAWQLPSGNVLGAGAAARRELGEVAWHRRARGSRRGWGGLCRAPAAALLCVSERRGASGRSLQPRASPEVLVLAARSNIMACLLCAFLFPVT